MIEDKLPRVGFETIVRVFTAALEPETGSALLRGAAASFRQFSSASLNSFIQVAPAEGISDFKEKVVEREFPDKSYVLDTAELASIYHLPNISVQTPAIAWATYKKGEPPANLPTSDCTYFAETTFHEKRIRFGLTREDRRRHSKCN